MEPIPVRMRERIVALYEQSKRTKEIAELMLGLTVDVRTVGRWLAKLGLVLKKSRSAPQNKIVPT